MYYFIVKQEHPVGMVEADNTPCLSAVLEPNEGMRPSRNFDSIVFNLTVLLGVFTFKPY